METPANHFCAEILKNMTFILTNRVTETQLVYVPMLELFLRTALRSARDWSVRALQNAALYIFLFSTAVALLGVRGQRSQLWGQRRVAERGDGRRVSQRGVCWALLPPPSSRLGGRHGDAHFRPPRRSRLVGRRSARESDDNKRAAVWTRVRLVLPVSTHVSGGWLVRHWVGGEGGVKVTRRQAHRTQGNTV